MGNTSNKENKKSDLKKTAQTVFTSTIISIPNERRNDEIAEDQIQILELFISPDKDICILLLKEKTFTGDFAPIYYIHIYYYDSMKNQFVIVLNYTIKDEIDHIEKALYDPNNNYILCYNTLKQVNDVQQNKFFLFKFEFLTRNNPKLGMNGYNMTKLLHPHINFFGKCRYATFLKQANELLFVFEKGYFILLSCDESTKQYQHINYFSSRSSYKYLTQRRHKKSSNASENSQHSQSPLPHNSRVHRKQKRGYRVIMASVHEKRDRITWIECEYNHYYLQIFSLKSILDNKHSQEYSNHSIDISHSETNKHKNGHSNPTNPVMKITPISIDMGDYLIVSRLIFANKKDLATIRCIFGENYDLEQFHCPTADHYGATKYREVIRRQSETQHEKDKYVLGSFFGINPLCIKLLFNRDGDKILYQSTGQMLHDDHSGENLLRHGDQYSGNLNDYGALHVIDVTTGNSLWSLGSSSKDIAFGWFNSYLTVLPSISSSSGLASSKSIYNPCKKAWPLQTPRNNKHSHLKLYGFVSETTIAETIYNQCENVEYINAFSWDLCVLLALYCGGMREYRQLSLTKWMMKNKTSNGTNIKLITNEIVSIWNANDNYYNLRTSEKRDWLIIALKEYREEVRYIDIVFYDAKQIAMHEHDVFIPYNDSDDNQPHLRQWYNGLIIRNLLAKSSTFDSLYYSSD